MYVYLKSEAALWTVGFHDPEGRWHAESDHPSPSTAADRVSFLNGDHASTLLAEDLQRAREDADRWKRLFAAQVSGCPSC